MAAKALRLRAEVEVHSVSCPGVFFPCKGPVGTGAGAGDPSLCLSLKLEIIIFKPEHKLEQGRCNQCKPLNVWRKL